MTQKLSLPGSELLDRPRFAAGATEDLLLGARRLRQAFAQSQTRFAGRDVPLIRAGESDPTVILIRSGFAFRSCLLADGRRAILDILVAGDVCGIDHIVLTRPIEDIAAAGRIGYQALSADTMRELMADPAIALHALALLAEARWRGDRLAASIGRLDAHARICVLLLDLHDRLRRRGLIAQPIYSLPLTQEQLADHLGLTLVHVNRTLRRLREERIVLLDRQVVIIQDLERLRAAAQGLPQPAELPEAALAAERGPIG